jgi:hypothetical protein
MFLSEFTGFFINGIDLFLHNLTERAHYEDLDIGGRMMLKLILEK